MLTGHNLRTIPAEDQKGINLVDLMMWLVIASLLLATALQGIGYYKKNANIYNMKEQVNAAASRVMANASLNGGTVDETIVAAVVADQNTKMGNTNITLNYDIVPSTAAGTNNPDNPYGMELASSTTAVDTAVSGQVLRLIASHKEITDLDVYYFLSDTGSYKVGIHIIRRDGSVLGGGSGTGSTATPSPTPTPTPTGTSTASPTPSPTPTVAPTPPADVNGGPGAQIQASYYYAADFTNRSVAATTSTPARFGFTVKDATSLSNFTVVWTGTGLDGTNTVIPATTSSATLGAEQRWYIDAASTPNGFKLGTSYITAQVTNKTTGETSSKTWTLNVVPQAAVASYYYGSEYNNRTIGSMTSTPARFTFILNNASPTDYNIVWTVNGVNAVPTQTGKTGTIGNERYFYSDIIPNATGFTTGTASVTATITHDPTGTVLVKSFTLTVVQQAPVASYYYGSEFTNRSVASMTSRPARFTFTLNNASATDYDVAWTVSDGVNAIPTQTGGTSTLGSERTFYSDIAPNATGFTAGTATVTATITHKATGTILTKTWTLDSTPQAVVASYYYGSQFSDRTIGSMTSRPVSFIFALKNASATDYNVSVNINGVNAVNAPTVSTSTLGSERYYSFNVVPNATGFTEGTAAVTATITHNATGATLTKTWNLVVDPQAIKQSYYYSNNWGNRSIAKTSTASQTFTYTLNNADTADFSTTWSVSGGNAVITTGSTSILGDERSYSAVVTPGTGGYTPGSTATITATSTSARTGAVLTKTWTITIAP